MITVKRLKELLAQLPPDWDDAKCVAYEGEGIGLSIATADGRYKWVSASPHDAEDNQPDFPEGE